MRPLAIIVEEFRPLGELIAFIFEQEGYEVELIQCGSKAMERLKEVTPDALIVDFYLTAIPGQQVVQWIQEQIRFAQTNIVVLISDLLTCDKMAALANFVLLKPFDVNDAYAIAAICKRASLNLCSISPFSVPKMVDCWV